MKRLKESGQERKKFATLKKSLPAKRDELEALETRIQNVLEQVETKIKSQEDILQRLGGTESVSDAAEEENTETPDDE